MSGEIASRNARVSRSRSSPYSGRLRSRRYLLVFSRKRTKCEMPYRQTLAGCSKMPALSRHCKPAPATRRPGFRIKFKCRLVLRATNNSARILQSWRLISKAQSPSCAREARPKPKSAGARNPKAPAAETQKRRQPKPKSAGGRNPKAQAAENKKRRRPKTKRAAQHDCSCCAALEKKPGSILLSHRVSPAVPSAQKDFTSVFGMGTGVAPSASPPGKRYEARTVAVQRIEKFVMTDINSVYVA